MDPGLDNPVDCFRSRGHFFGDSGEILVEVGEDAGALQSVEKLPRKARSQILPTISANCRSVHPMTRVNTARAPLCRPERRVYHCPEPLNIRVLGRLEMALVIGLLCELIKKVRMFW